MLFLSAKAGADFDRNIGRHDFQRERGHEVLLITDLRSLFVAQCAKVVLQRVWQIRILDICLVHSRVAHQVRFRPPCCSSGVHHPLLHLDIIEWTFAFGGKVSGDFRCGLATHWKRRYPKTLLTEQGKMPVNQLVVILVYNRSQPA